MCPLMVWIFAMTYERTHRRAVRSQRINLHLQQLAREKDGFLSYAPRHLPTTLLGPD
jgi:hypothetical protein